VKGESRVIRCAAFRWEGVAVESYKPDPKLFSGVTRQTVLGEGPGEGAATVVTRYFEVQPGGFSTLELHEHWHFVVVLRGEGTVTLGDEVTAIAPYDAVYVAPLTAHQFRATGTEPLGFICIVDRVRDNPVPLARR
jgi:quercetin dioxygenase-like cupin family protein